MQIKASRPYFAHQVNAYNTDLEAGVHLLISKYLGIRVRDVVNPNSPEHQAGYQRYANRQKLAETKHGGMNYFFDEVLPKCDAGVMWGYLDGRIGLGVAGEMQKLLSAGKNGFVVHLTRTATRAELERFESGYRTGPFEVRPISEEEKALLFANDPRLVLSHEETRLRTWYIYNKKQRPYREAHLATMPLPDDFYPDDKK